MLVTEMAIRLVNDMSESLKRLQEANRDTSYSDSVQKQRREQIQKDTAHGLRSLKKLQEIKDKRWD